MDLVFALSMGVLSGITALVVGVGIGYWAAGKEQMAAAQVALHPPVIYQQHPDHVHEPKTNGNGNRHGKVHLVINGKEVVGHSSGPGPVGEPGPAHEESELKQAIEILRAHVGHDISIVTHSLGSKGVLICNTCGENVPLKSHTMIEAVQSGVSDADL